MGTTRIKVSQTKQLAIVVPTEALDMAWAKAMRQVIEELLDAGKTRLVVDLRGITYIDSAGLGELVRGMKRAREAGGDLRLCGVRREVLRIFKMTGLNKAIALYPTRKKAAASWR